MSAWLTSQLATVNNQASTLISSFPSSDHFRGQHQFHNLRPPQPVGTISSKILNLFKMGRSQASGGETDAMEGEEERVEVVEVVKETEVVKQNEVVEAEAVAADAEASGDGDGNKDGEGGKDRKGEKDGESEKDGEGEDKEENAANDADAGDEEEDVGEEEYEVETILDHKGTKGNYTYLVAWKGYGAEHNTWEPQAHVEHATDLVEAYWEKKAKLPSSARSIQKRKAVSSPAPTPSRKPKASALSSQIKPSPLSTQVKGSPLATQQSRAWSEKEDTDASLNFADTHKDDVGPFLEFHDWEPLVAHIDTIERGYDAKLVVYVTMKSGERLAVGNDVLNKRCPQTVIAFYESHLKWRA